MTLVISTPKVLLRTFLILALVFHSSSSSKGGEEAGKKRRQVFREDVSPLLGGKVPSGAFDWARLMFNNLDSRGISIPDGFILSNDRQQVRNQEKRIKLYSKDGKEVIDSTYTVRNPVAASVKNFRNEGHRHIRYRNKNDDGSKFIASPTDEFAWETEPTMNHWSSIEEGNEFEDCDDNGLRYAPEHSEAEYPMRNPSLDEIRSPQHFWTHEDWIRNQENFRLGNLRHSFHGDGSRYHPILEDTHPGFHRNRNRNRLTSGNESPTEINKHTNNKSGSHKSNKPSDDDFESNKHHGNKNSAPDGTTSNPNSVEETPGDKFQDTNESENSGERSNRHPSHDSFNDTNYNSADETPRSIYPFHRNRNRNNLNPHDRHFRRPLFYQSDNQNNYDYSAEQNSNSAHPFRQHGHHHHSEDSGEENETERPIQHNENFNSNSVEENSSGERFKLKIYQNPGGESPGHQISGNALQNQGHKDRDQIKVSNSNQNFHSDNNENSVEENPSGDRVKHNYKNPMGENPRQRPQIQGNRHGLDYNYNTNQNGHPGSDNSAEENFSGENEKHKYQNPNGENSGQQFLGNTESYDVNSNLNQNYNSENLSEGENSERFGSVSKVPGKFGESGSSSALGNDEENDAINPKPFMLINGNPMGIHRNKSSSSSGSSSSSSHGDNEENNFTDDRYRDKLIDDIISRMQITSTVAPSFVGQAPGPPPPPLPPGLPDSILKVTLFSHPSPPGPGSIIESINGPPGFLKNKKRKGKFKSILQKLFEPFRP